MPGMNGTNSMTSLMLAKPTSRVETTIHLAQDLSEFAKIYECQSFSSPAQANEIVLVPVSDGYWGYLVMLYEWRGRLLDFTTDYPTRKRESFIRASLMLPLHFNCRFPKRFQTVGHFDLDAKELLGPATVCKHTPHIQQFKGGATPYEVFLPGGLTKFVTKEEAESYFPTINLDAEKRRKEENMPGI
jgi:hypothetical protein